MYNLLKNIWFVTVLQGAEAEMKRRMRGGTSISEAKQQNYRLKDLLERCRGLSSKLDKLIGIFHRQRKKAIEIQEECNMRIVTF